MGRRRSEPLGNILGALERTDHGRTADEVYAVLQSGIVSGRIPPGSLLPQIEVARVLKVSRTPVREAMRKLEAAGLLIGEPHNGARVASLDPADIEAVLVKLVVLEALAIVLTSLAMTSPLMRRLYGLLDALDDASARRDPAAWLAQVAAFQDLVISEAGAPLAGEIRALRQQIVRFRRDDDMPPPWPATLRWNVQYRRAIDAMSAQEGRQAAERIVRLTAATAARLLKSLAPTHDPVKIRAALDFATFGSELPQAAFDAF